MLFIKNEELKIGMRIAKPIYNKKGVLLYERNSKLTEQGIDSVKNFGLIGLYILEPAEPVPPMTKDDIEFEKFQTVNVFRIQDELMSIKKTGKASKMSMITADIIRAYGRLDHKINFVQNLRSNEDYIYKHSLNCAILCAMITHVMNVRLEEQLDTVIAALVHDIGKLNIPKELADKGNNLTNFERAEVDKYERMGISLVETCFSSSPSIKRIMLQTNRTLSEFRLKGSLPAGKLVTGTRIMLVAETFDTMTAMNDYKEPSSEIAALRHLQENPQIYDPEVVDALVASVNFLSTGCCVELNNGEKGLVLSSNDVDVLRPMVLCFGDNRIVDLGHEVIYGDLEIKDVMKTMDNRCVVDRDLLKKFGGNPDALEDALES